MTYESLPPNDWGVAVWDEEGFPCFDYFPPPPAVRRGRRMAVRTDFPIGNPTIKVLHSGMGVCFPLILAEMGHGGVDVFSLCGDPRAPGLFGGGRLYLVEGGLAKPVVGPDHEEADSSNVETASCRLSPTWVERRFVVFSIEVRHRLAVSLGGVPAVVSIYSVKNGSEGVRWLSLFDMWDVTPWVPEAKVPKPLVGRMLASAFGFSKGPVLNNSCFEVSYDGTGSRVEMDVRWRAKEGRRLFRSGHPVSFLRIQFARLTDNVEVEVRERPPGLGAGVPALGSAVCQARVGFHAKFQLRPGEVQVGTGVVYVGSWEEAQTGLRSLLPLNMFLTNEGLIWKRKKKFTLEALSPHQRAASQWESAWRWGLLRSALWKEPESGEVRVAPGGSATFYEKRWVDWPSASAATAVLAYGEPQAAQELLASLARRIAAMLNSFPHTSQERPLENLLWFLWGLSEYMAAVGDSAAACLGANGPALFSAVASFLSRPELRGAMGLPTTRWADENELVHEIEGIPPRSTGAVESVLAGAMLVAVCEALACQMDDSLDAERSRLKALAQECRGVLEGLFTGSQFPRWVWKGKQIGTKRVFLDHHVWLLLAGLPPRMEREVFSLLARTMLGETPAGVPSLDGPFDEPGFKLKSGARSGRPVLSRLLTALLLGPLSRLSPETTRFLLDGMNSDILLQQYPGSFQLSFLTPGVIPLGHRNDPSSVEKLLESEGNGAPEWMGAICACLGRLKGFGLRGIEGGLAVHTALLEHFSLSTATLSLLQSGANIVGEWNGVTPERKIELHFGRYGQESSNTSKEGSRPAAVEVIARRGQRWLVQRG